MQCEEVKKLLPNFLDDELKPDEKTDIQVHLSSCEVCQKELKAYRNSWELLKQWSDLEPQPAYLSRFWTELALRTPWYTSFLRELRLRFLTPKIATVWITACLLLAVSILIAKHYWQIQEVEMVLTNLPLEEVELIENIELAENYEVIQDMDLLEDLEVLENWENGKS